jgi:ethanolamine ammonia-lyase small subunit
VGAAGGADAERNCISNVRGEGLSYAAAAEMAAWVMRAARGAARLTGVGLNVLGIGPVT